jgi:tetratricopeptide (TPR) repeat protein
MKHSSQLALLFLSLLLLSITAGSSLAARPDTTVPENQQIQAAGIVDGVVNKLWDQTDHWWHAGDYPRVVALDRIITEADPQFLEAYSNGGWLMDSLGRTRDAEAYYTLGTKNNPHAAYAFWNLGFFYFNSTRDYAAAARAFKSDAEQEDSDLNDWKMLGHAQEKAKQWDAAVATWHTIKARWPNGMSVDRLLRESEEKRAQALGMAQTEGKPALP